jgi:hypothetical protein
MYRGYGRNPHSLRRRTGEAGRKIRVVKAWWCTPAIPALGRLRQEDQGQPGLHCEILSQKQNKKDKMVS